MTDDPERLVAEALRAHAARTPLPAPTTDTETGEGNGPALGGYGLLSGSDLAKPTSPPAAQQPSRSPGRIDPTVRDPSSTEETNRLDPGGSVAVGWILLLALLLGLASGAVVGLVTLL